MGVGHKISPEGASYASSMAIEEGCLTAGNVFALISVGMVVIGHLHFSFLLCALKRIGCPLGVLGSRGILSWALYGSCWLSIPQKSDCGIDSQGVASAKSARLPFASIDILSTKMIDLRESFKQNSSCSPLPYCLSANVRWRTSNGG